MAGPQLPPSSGTSRRSWVDHVGDLADRLGTSVAVLLGGAAALLVVAVVAVLLWSEDAPPPPELTIPRATIDTTVTPSTTTPSTVLAHAAGAVANPGVYSLPLASRVGDLLAAAGGPVDGADLDRLNLAAPVLDGSRVYVPRVDEESAPTVLGPDVETRSASGGDPGEGGPVDINTADQQALETLPGIGPATAAAIIAHREEQGPFASVDDLLDVSGIGVAKLEAIRDLVAV